MMTKRIASLLAAIATTTVIMCASAQVAENAGIPISNATDTVAALPTAAASPATGADERVIVGNDTVSMIIPARNFGRYDRGLFNYLYIPRGQWAFGMTASYGEFNTEDVQVLSMLKDINFNGKTYQLSPTVSYFIRNNQALGLKFAYTRAEADLASLSMDVDDDINFDLTDVSYYSQSYGVSFFYRNYIGLSALKRFAVFNEVELAVSSGSSRFRRNYNNEPRDTKTISTTAALNFSPGVCMFIMDYISFQVSFGVFGIKVTHDKQSTNGVEEGSRTSSGANFKFNLFNIKFGIGVHI